MVYHLHLHQQEHHFHHRHHPVAGVGLPNSHHHGHTLLVPFLQHLAQTQRPLSPARPCSIPGVHQSCLSTFDNLLHPATQQNTIRQLRVAAAATHKAESVLEKGTNKPARTRHRSDHRHLSLPRRHSSTSTSLQRSEGKGTCGTTSMSSSRSSSMNKKKRAPTTRFAFVNTRRHLLLVPHHYQHLVLRHRRPNLSLLVVTLLVIANLLECTGMLWIQTADANSGENGKSRNSNNNKAEAYMGQNQHQRQHLPLRSSLRHLLLPLSFLLHLPFVLRPGHRHRHTPRQHPPLQNGPVKGISACSSARTTQLSRQNGYQCLWNQPVSTRRTMACGDCW